MWNDGASRPKPLRFSLNRASPQLEGAQMKFVFVGRRRHFDERKGSVRELLPDGQIFRRHGEPPEPEHVPARFGHASGLLPCDLVGDQRFPRRWSWLFTSRSATGCFAIFTIQRAAGSRRPQPDGISKRRSQSTDSGIAAFVTAANCACLVIPSTTGNCSTVARCPSQSSVTSTLLPSGNSIASW